MMMADPRGRQMMGERAYERVVDRFLPDTHLREWGQLLADVLAVPERRRADRRRRTRPTGPPGDVMCGCCSGTSSTLR
jgi:hypothetical protein